MIQSLIQLVTIITIHHSQVLSLNELVFDPINVKKHSLTYILFNPTLEQKKIFVGSFWTFKLICGFKCSNRNENKDLHIINEKGGTLVNFLTNIELRLQTKCNEPNALLYKMIACLFALKYFFIQMKFWFFLGIFLNNKCL
jgi:hypothetical protein